MLVRSAKPSATSLVLITATLLLAAQFAVAQAPAPQAEIASPAAIPSPILNAKTVFLANGGAEGGLFPEPFSGDPNRAYFSFFSLLKNIGKYDMVSDPSQADLVMEIQLFSPSGPRNSDKSMGAADPWPFFKLTIYDAKTRFPLWTITEPIEWAVLQKTHNRNFDEALSRLLADVQALSQPHPGGLYPMPSPHLGAWRR